MDKNQSINTIRAQTVQVFVQILDFVMKNLLNRILGLESFGSKTAQIQHSIVRQLKVNLNGHVCDVLPDRIVCDAQVKRNRLSQIRFREPLAQHSPFVRNLDRKFVFRLKVVLFGSRELFEFFLTDKMADVFGLVQDDTIDLCGKEKRIKIPSQDRRGKEGGGGVTFDGEKIFFTPFHCP